MSDCFVPPGRTSPLAGPLGASRERAGVTDPVAHDGAPA